MLDYPRDGIRARRGSRRANFDTKNLIRLARWIRFPDRSGVGLRRASLPGDFHLALPGYWAETLISLKTDLDREICCKGGGCPVVRPGLSVVAPGALSPTKRL